MKIAFIGLGEAAGAIIGGWGAGKPAQISAFDIKSRDPATAPEIADRAEALGVEACTSAEDALAGADLVLSVVTADQAEAAARGYAPGLAQGATWCDLNSCAPATKQRSCAVIEAAGGRYLDVAVMAPVYPRRNLVPCLISGSQAADIALVLEGLPMSVKVVGTEVGRASSIKMVRSIMVKGLEALTAECALAAVAAGVAEDVFPSLEKGHPQIDVPQRAAYNFERSLVHGTRRAAEMDEVAKMLTDLGLPNDASHATAQWERRMGAMDVDPGEGGEAPDYAWFAKRILKALND